MQIASHPRNPAGIARWKIYIPVLGAALLHAAFLASYLFGHHGSLSALVCVDQNKIGRWPFEAIDVGFAADGYDGQFYYVLARAPWRWHVSGDLDAPSYRHVRLLYPALAWLISGGDPEALLWALPAINLGAVLLLAWLGARLAVHYGRSPWWGCLLPVALNAGMPALRDLTDPLASAALCGMIAAYLLDWKVGWLAVWAVAAAFSREQNAAIVLLVMGDSLLRRRWLHAGALAGSLTLFLGWVVTLRMGYGTWPTSGVMDTPFSGIGYCLTHLAGRYGKPPLVNMLGLLVILSQITLCACLLAVAVFSRSEGASARPHRLTAGIALAGIALALLGGAPIYQSGWSYARVFVWMPLGVWLWSMQSGLRWPALALCPAIMWPTLASLQPWLK